LNFSRWQLARAGDRGGNDLQTPAAVTTTVKAASEGDIALVQRLADVTWRRHYPGILGAEQIDYMLARGYSRDALLEFVTSPDAGLALAVRDGRALGFAAWYRLEGGRSAKLDKLYVLPDHHGEGIGRALIEHVVAWARTAGCGAVTLNVNRHNTTSVRAYERCGFSIRERGDFSIGNGFVMEDFIMVRDL
jgi:GNAT superfamily N-acetyltransferase